ncbi:hypothetical protein GCM10010347_63430 [Streptomyces cirratus]|uniref:Uncharacterized protein n=1 Tax=Streptomyces cirratus TaxID=68187 RepID=A0ABQ3F4S7_9ACTN|nr:hypothetical protein GCM10010347_63430 [Streptomyces cirratus]
MLVVQVRLGKGVRASSDAIETPPGRPNGPVSAMAGVARETAAPARRRVAHARFIVFTR